MLVAMFVMYFAEDSYVKTLSRRIKESDIVDKEDARLLKFSATAKELHAILWGICIMLPILIASKWSVRAEVWTVLFIAVGVHMYIDKKGNTILPAGINDDHVACILMVILLWLTWISYL